MARAVVVAVLVVADHVEALAAVELKAGAQVARGALLRAAALLVEKVRAAARAADRAEEAHNAAAQREVEARKAAARKAARGKSERRKALHALAAQAKALDVLPEAALVVAAAVAEEAKAAPLRKAQPSKSQR